MQQLFFFLESGSHLHETSHRRSAARFTQYLTEKSTGRRRPQGGSTVRSSPCHKNTWLKATLSLNKSEQPVPIFFFFFLAILTQFSASQLLEIKSENTQSGWKLKATFSLSQQIWYELMSLCWFFSIVGLVAAASTIWTRFNLRK